ncbi:heat stress transcription factor A-8 [Nicotiana tabacum]|uniref:Heat stress transcription factor A-8 n=2 Tax=Nicotiana TaxID=4085 RepID=A0A1S4CVV8_TOBAC|nr:PREDICTED: heat stress transcription factor A-8 [Nicotiana sylvestris]XP_016505243.1 PREDICTED: heat stress transcription factor A-8 [Nicotiana tabacum]
MVKSFENVAPFLLKCYEMVEDESTDSLISWDQSDNNFIIWDVPKFSSQLLPKYFKHSNFSSFVRQLNIYGFHKTDTDRWEFANDSFLKGQKHLLKNIVRRKQSSVVQKKSSQKEESKSCKFEENKSLELWEEVENLKTDKNVLTEELVKLRQHQQNSESKLILLREQLKVMEKHQQQMLSFIVMAMQSPNFLVQFFQPKENNWRVNENGNNILSDVEDYSEDTPSDRAIVRYHPPTHEAAEPLCAELETAVDTQKPMELDLSCDEIKDLFSNIDFFSGLMDEKLLSFENSVPLTLPDLPDDEDMLEQLLLSQPITENKEDE